jgi:di/tricarboxylate transporter
LPRRAIGACILLALGVLALGALPPMPRAALLVVAAIALWSTGALAEHVTALLFFLLALISGVAPPEVVLSGFHSEALWLIFAGLIVGVAVARCGLAQRIAAMLASRAGARYTGVVGIVVLIGIVLTFAMPSSMGRVVMLMPIALALAERLGYAPASKGRSGIALAAVLGAYLPSAGVLPSNLPNIVLTASAEQLYGVRFSYAEYLLLAFPSLGILKAAAIVALISRLYAEAPARPAQALGVPTPWSPQERAVGIVLGAAMALWVTDFLHGVSPAWVALAAAVICMLPFVGLFPAEAFNRDLSFVAVFHAAGVIGLGAVVAYSGFGDVLGGAMAALAPFSAEHPLANFWLLGLLSTATCLVTTTTGVPAVLTPLSAALAEASGLPLKAVLLSQVIGFSSPIFPYEGAPLVFALHYAGLPARAAIGLLLALALFTLVVLTPLTYAWWALLGYVPS